MHKDGPDSKITRRQALQAIALLPVQVYSLTHLPSEQVLPEEALSLCAAGFTACIELQNYRPEGITAMQRILAAYLSPLEQTARRSSSAQTTAARLTAQGYLLVGTVAEHYGRLDQMEAACRMARFYAQRAQDVNLETIAINRLAVKFDYERRDRKSLETYLEATALPGFSTLTPLIQGRVYAGLATTHAYCQQKPQALSFLSQARDIYPQDPETDPNYAFAYCTPGTFTMWEGLTLKHTGQYAQAIEAFSRFGNITHLAGVSEVNRAAHLTYAASVAIRQRELDMACTYLDAAEEAAWTIHHEQRLAEMRDTFRDAQLLWPDEPRVRDLQEKIHARQA